MTILFAESPFWLKHLDFREKYARCIRESYEAARGLLPVIPEELTFVNQVAPWECMEEYGQGAYTKNSRLILIAIDDSLPYGEEKLLQSTHETVFHELSHAARFEIGRYHSKFLDSCVLEGLATAFERDYADAEPPYGDYDHDQAEQWLKEIIDANEKVDHYEYMFRRSDGSRWIGYKVGTYIVDQAAEKSGKSILELTNLESSEILNLAGIDRGSQKKL